MPSDVTGTVYRVHITTIPSKAAKWFGGKAKEYSGVIFMARNKWYVPNLGKLDLPEPMPEKLLPMFNKVFDQWLLNNWGDIDAEDGIKKALEDRALFDEEVDTLDKARDKWLNASV